jgi:signal transduction histidine kinase
MDATVTASALPERLARGLALVVVVVSASVVLGWALHVPLLVTLLPHLVSIKLNTALCLLALGASVGRLVPGHRWLPVPVLAVTTAMLVEHVTGTSLGIDELLVEDFTWAPGGDPPGRMAIATAVGLSVLAAALLAQERGRVRSSQVLASLGLVTGFVALLGYGYGVSSLQAVVAYSTVALHTAVLLVLLSVAVLARQPDGYVPWLLVGQDPGAVVGRWLVAVALLGLPALGAAQLAGQRAGWYDGVFGLALTVLVSAAVIVALALVTGRRLQAVDVARRAALAELETLVDSLREGRDEAWGRAERTVRELAAERTRFARSVGQIDDQFCTLAVDGDGHVEFHFATPDPVGLISPVVDRLTGRTSVPLRDAASERSLGTMTGQVRAGGPVNAELQVVGADGATRWVWVRGTPRSEGDQLYLDLVATNVDERHALTERLEEALAVERHQRDELERVNRLKDEFVAMAGHELRGPLAVIGGNLELLALTSPTPEQAGPLQTIRRRVEGMQTLVDDLFDLARLRSGAVSVDPAHVPVAAAARDVAAGLEPEARAGEVHVEVDDAGAADLTAYCDPQRLHQMLANLVGNAIKYTPPGGRVRLEVTGAGDRVRVVVLDTGIGVAEADLPHLFERFYRARSARDGQVSGTGLGLAITHALAEAQGGSVRAERREGGGMRFVLDLPRHPVGSAPAPARGTSVPPGLKDM